MRVVYTNNFEYNNEAIKDFADFGKKAEKYIYQSPQDALTAFRTLGEALLNDIYEKDRIFVEIRVTASEYSTQDKKIKLLSTYNRKIGEVYYPENIINNFKTIKNTGNIAAHNIKSKFFTVEKALEIDKVMYKIWSWYLEIYTSEECLPYVKPENTAVNNDEELKDEVDKLKKKIEELKKRNEQQKEKVDSSKKQERQSRSRKYQQTHDLSEEETREIIDQQLRDAGWEANTKKLNNNKNKNKTLPKKGKRMAIAEWVLSNGKRADYALFEGLNLVGVVEAKEWGKDIPGDLTQAKEYAKLITKDPDVYNLVVKDDATYKVPFIYSTNGRPYIRQYKSKSGIWYLDTRNLNNHAKPLQAWHSPDDLKLKLSAKPEKEANEDLKNESMLSFANRYYQVEAIRAVENAIIDGKKRILLQMATGTGKTRTAIALMYHLLKAKKARRILYLVDRNSLGRQTEDTLKNLKVDATSIADIYGVKALSGGKVEKDTKIHIATVQSMISRLFSGINNDESVTVGTYDFIIVDEAHRGYALDRDMREGDERIYDEQDYVSQYRRVIDFFDATSIAMTATPAKHTVEIFGSPIYSYSYRQAVLDGWLIDHDTPYVFKTELSENGINFEVNEDVTVYDSEKNTISTETLDENMNFDVSQFNRRVIANDFNRVIAEKLTEYIDPTDEMAGKTLIFAVTDKHADDFVIALKDAYEKAGIPVPDDAIQKITGQTYEYGQAIKNFKNETYPNIVVTVDLLTTGIDVPEITNIVFLRQVRSRILYEQMIGRATRPCEKIQKDHFNIYDAVGIYDKMKSVSNMNMVVKDPNHNLDYYVNKTNLLDYEDEADYETYREDLLATIQRKIKRIPEDKLSEFCDFAKINSTNEWTRSIKNMSKEELSQEMPKIAKLASFKYNDAKMIISDKEDRFKNVDRSYGDSGKKPEDYLESFNQYIQNNQNELLGLEIIKTRPQDLSLSELKEIVLTLSQYGYNERDLQNAWKKVKGEQTAASIISFIRQAMMTTDRLEDHEAMVNRAMNKVYGMTEWTVMQRKWLDKIAKQLKQNEVLGKNAQQAFDTIPAFKSNGGYNRVNKLLDGKADEIIKIINENLYA